MTNPKHTSSDLVERLRGDWPEILVEKHWMMDSDAIDKQRAEAADRIEALEAENERLRADRAAVEASTIAKVVAWLRDVLDPLDEDHDGWLATGVADAIEAGKWKQ